MNGSGFESTSSDEDATRLEPDSALSPVDAGPGVGGNEAAKQKESGANVKRRRWTKEEDSQLRKSRIANVCTVGPS